MGSVMLTRTEINKVRIKHFYDMATDSKGNTHEVYMGDFYEGLLVAQLNKVVRMVESIEMPRGDKEHMRNAILHGLRL